MIRAFDHVSTDDQARQRSFTGEKLDLLKAISADERLDARAFEVAFCIVMHVNKETGVAFIAGQTISDKTSIPLRWVTKALSDLRNRGWIGSKRTGNANIYWMLVEQLPAVLKHQNVLKSRRKEKREKRRTDCHDTPRAAHLKDGDAQPVADRGAQPVADRDTPQAAYIHLSQNTLALTPSKVRAPKTPLSDDWKPSEEDLAYAVTKGFRGDRLETEVEKFSNFYWGNGAVRLSWAATWRKWVLTSCERGGPAARSGRGEPQAIF